MNHTIHVAVADHLFRVTVTAEDGTRTKHTVTVSDDYAATLGWPPDDRSARQDLVHRSFEFLLEREPQTSILPNFELSRIEQYFPEFPDVIGY